MTDHPSPSGQKPSSKTPRTERELIEQALDQAHSPRTDGFSFPGDLPAPGTFPGYELIREIHRGGQGAVFLAVQLATKRRVAIKLMHGGPFRGSSGRARFEREVQILGQLNHPNIVRIHDSGTTTDGSHFYVMDYVSGRSLDEVISADKRPTVEETLKLFLKICEGINAAHLKGIIHRDIKPSNIRIGNAGDPIVVDFGLAKVALPGGSSDQTPAIMSMTGQFIGSLPWASPEQAEGVHDNVDVRTDVYSLGVVLYQLLTGKFPYDVIGNMRDVLDRILRAEPARPSTVRRQINDEVETIVLKCLAKERDRRYQSAGELARDIERYLAGQPIEAKRDSILYVFTKTARRFWIPATAMGAGIAGIAVFAVVMSVLYRQKSVAEAGLASSLAQTQRLQKQTQDDLDEIRKAREAERVQREKAAAATEAALIPVRQMIFEFDPAMKNLVGATRLRLGFLKAGEGYLAHLESKVGSDPSVLREVAATHQRLGEMMAAMFEKRIAGLEQGAEHFAQAQGIREKLAAASPEDPIARADLARSVRSNASLVRMEQKPAEARAQYQRAIELFDAALARLAPDAKERRDIEEGRVDCIVGLASSLARMTVLAGDAAEAAELQEDSERQYGLAEAYWNARSESDPSDARAAREAVRVRSAQAQFLVSSIAARLRAEKKFDQAIAVLDRVDRLMPVSVERQRALGAAHPEDRILKRDLEVSLHYAGWSLQERADSIQQRAKEAKAEVPTEHRAVLERALVPLTEAYEIASGLASSDLDDLESKRDLGTICNKLGNIEYELGKSGAPGKIETAVGHFERSLAIRRELKLSDPLTRYTADLIVGLMKVGNIEKELAARARPGAAKDHLERSIARYQEALPLARELISQSVRPADWNVVPQTEAAIQDCEATLRELKEPK